MTKSSALPVLVEGNGDIQIYERDGELCMSTEDLGKCLGYENPTDAMAKLFERNKEELEEWRFSCQSDRKTSGGRPSFFYLEEGIYVAAMLARTEVAKEFRKRVARLLRHLRLQLRLQTQEKLIASQEKIISMLEYQRKAGTRLSDEERAAILDLHSQGIEVREIARRLKRSPSGISNFIKTGKTSGRVIPGACNSEEFGGRVV